MERTEQINSWITVREAARISGYGMDWLRKLARENEVKCQKLGYTVLIDRESLEEYVEVQKRKAN